MYVNVVKVRKCSKLHSIRFHLTVLTIEGSFIFPGLLGNEGFHTINYFR